VRLESPLQAGFAIVPMKEKMMVKLKAGLFQKKAAGRCIQALEQIHRRKAGNMSVKALVKKWFSAAYIHTNEGFPPACSRNFIPVPWFFDPLGAKREQY